MTTLKTWLLATLLCAFAWQAGASVPLGGNRKGVGGAFDMYGCMQSNNYYVVNFAAYQFDPSQTKDSKTLPTAECIDIPSVGKTQITLDLLDRDVRKKPVALKILREDGATLAELPMAVAKQGVVSVGVDFKSPGKYQATLLVNDTDLHTDPEISALHIPLTVALVVEQPATEKPLWIFFIVIGILVAALAYFLPRLLRSKPADA
ncbi:hypothetical protein [Methylomonas fluvii]|uniref:Uncharacterized protein n=1 Tax=Methylomonas fluvii TaxID=1854564 RepID=A0ABR9DKV4_9GAMM|nr:hypothetical protein [Methylomonas fluvii]MBD9363734.1 hypothetical protein [Methylomonas fluvii]CAD6877040.1 hypothetical protein [Methylomonas fluvii]